MKFPRAALCLLAAPLMLPCFAQAQNDSSTPQAAAKPAELPPATMTTIVDKQISGLEKDLVSAAEAMPADKYNFAPTTGEFKGVRTFAQQVKHIAVANTIMWSAAAGEKTTLDPNQDNGPDSMTSKDDIVKFLKDSFVIGHRAAQSLTAANALERYASPWGNAPRLYWATSAIGHAFDHYGQMVVYLRLNSIIPPASQPQKK